MAPDKHYLEGILTKLSTQTHIDTPCHKQVTSKAQEALKYLIERRDFWSQQNPDYTGTGSRRMLRYAALRVFMKKFPKKSQIFFKMGCPALGIRVAFLKQPDALPGQAPKKNKNYIFLNNF
jgi:hypothetical protein